MKHLAGKHDQKKHGRPGSNSKFDVSLTDKIQNRSSVYTSLFSAGGAGLEPRMAKGRPDDDGEKEAKKILAQSISKRTAIPCWAVNALVKAWADGTDEPISQLLKKTVSEELDITPSSWDQNQMGEDESRVGVGLAMLADTSIFGKDSPTSSAEAKTWVKKFVRDVYTQTQKFLKENGVEELVLYRGMTIDNVHGTLDDPKTVKIHDNILSSWTSEMVTAAMFGEPWLRDNIVLEARIPASKIFSMARIGIGCFGEAEFVALGDTRQCRVFNRHDSVLANAPIDTGERVEHNGRQVAVYDIANVPETFKRAATRGLEITDENYYYYLGERVPDRSVTPPPAGYFSVRVDGEQHLGRWSKTRTYYPNQRANFNASGWDSVDRQM